MDKPGGALPYPNYFLSIRSRPVPVSGVYFCSASCLWVRKNTQTWLFVVLLGTFVLVMDKSFLWP